MPRVSAVASKLAVLANNTSWAKTKLKQFARYLKANLGSSLVISFLVLLALATFSLEWGNFSISNQLAVFAFYLLILGVAVQVVDAVREKRKRDRQGSGADS